MKREEGEGVEAHVSPADGQLPAAPVREAALPPARGHPNSLVICLQEATEALPPTSANTFLPATLRCASSETPMA